MCCNYQPICVVILAIIFSLSFSSLSSSQSLRSEAVLFQSLEHNSWSSAALWQNQVDWNENKSEARWSRLLVARHFASDTASSLATPCTGTYARPRVALWVVVGLAVGSSFGHTEQQHDQHRLSIFSGKDETSFSLCTTLTTSLCICVHTNLYLKSFCPLNYYYFVIKLTNKVSIFKKKRSSFNFNNKIWIVGNVTRWLDWLFNIWSFSTVKMCPITKN